MALSFGIFGRLCRTAMVIFLYFILSAAKYLDYQYLLFFCAGMCDNCASSIEIKEIDATGTILLCIILEIFIYYLFIFPH